MRLIHFCQMCGANSPDYLIEPQRHARGLRSRAAESMPWNCRERPARGGYNGSCLAERTGCGNPEWMICCGCKTGLSQIRNCKVFRREPETSEMFRK